MMRCAIKNIMRPSLGILKHWFSEVVLRVSPGTIGHAPIDVSCDRHRERRPYDIRGCW